MGKDHSELQAPGHSASLCLLGLHKASVVDLEVPKASLKKQERCKKQASKTMCEDAEKQDIEDGWLPDLAEARPTGRVLGF